MDRNLAALEPALVWKHFAEIVRIPRPSSHEENVHLYMKEVDGRTAVEINDVAPGSHVGSAPLGGE